MILYTSAYQYFQNSPREDEKENADAIAYWKWMRQKNDPELWMYNLSMYKVDWKKLSDGEKKMYN